MRIAVTGAAGFLGTALVNKLQERNHLVSSLDPKYGNPTYDFDSMEVTLTDFEPDIIAHLGASGSTPLSFRNPRLDFRNNALGTFNVVDWARQRNIPVLYTSTVKVHPGYDGKVAPYGLSKKIGEDYVKLYDIPYIINRMSTVYGPGQNGSADCGWLYWFLKAAKTNQTITINGDGTQSRDVLYVDDVIGLLVDQIENFPSYQNRTYDVGGGQENELSLLDLLHKLNYNNFVFGPRMPADLQRVVSDNSLVTSVRGWKPDTNWLNGLDKTWESIR